MAGEINFGLLDTNAPAKVGNAFFQGQQEARQAQQDAMQNKLAQLSLGQKQQEIADSSRMNDLYRSATGADGTIDAAKLYSGAAQAGLGSKIPDLQKRMADAKTAQLQQHKAEIDQHLQTFQAVGQILAPVKDQAGWDQARQQVAQTVGPEIAAQMPAVYDPATVQRNIMQALSAKDQLEQTSKAIDQQLNADKFTYQKKNDAANRAVTMRGQDMTDARARDEGIKKVDKDKRQHIDDALSVINILDQAKDLIDKSTNSYGGAAIDAAARSIGYGTEGSQAASQLKALEGTLISKMPKMSGPQSDKDVLLYKQMAGQIGDSTIPAANKKAAMSTIRALNEKYLKDNGVEISKSPAPATPSGSGVKFLGFE